MNYSYLKNKKLILKMSNIIVKAFSYTPLEYVTNKLWQKR